MPAKRKIKLGPSPTVAFANSLLESVARASGAGWFNARQQSRLRLIIRDEFADLADEGLLFGDVHLDQLEAKEEKAHWPEGARPDLYDTLEATDLIGPDDEDEDESVHSEAEAETLEAEVEFVPPAPQHKVMVIPC